MKELRFDRRAALGATVGLLSLASTGAAARAIAAPGAASTAQRLRGPAVDLATPDGNVTAMAKLAADLDLARTKHGWYRGGSSA
jgi:hypothetical protein